MADTLIAYFSWSGRSAALAQKLHRRIPGSDLYHIATKRAYAKHFVSCAAQAAGEKKRDERPDLQTHLSGKQVQKFDRIILLYPIWCGTCPMAVRTFLESIRTDRLDLFPVALSMTTDVRRSVEDIRASAPEAAIAEGLRLSGKKADTPESLDAVMQYLGLQENQ